LHRGAPIRYTKRHEPLSGERQNKRLLRVRAQPPVEKRPDSPP
jgi:hypothetical protein